MNGRLYITATPIGNLEDITPRAKRILGEVDLIACEDTRITRKLLNHLGIKKTLKSYHEHNEAEQSVELIKELKQGKNIALVTDAGTPCISDPGYRLVKVASENDVRVITIPGPCAAISALSISGLPTSSFIFIGFLPKTSKKTKDELGRVKSYPQTLIFYESPNRIIKTLTTIEQVLGDRCCSVSRELTKVYEETLRGTITEVISYLNQKDKIKGEFVITIEGCSTDNEINGVEIEQELQKFKQQGETLKNAVKYVSEIYSIKKNEVYKTALKTWEHL